MLFGLHLLQVTYTVRVKLHQRGEVINTDCECPAGKGPHGTCKHVAALLVMMSNFLQTGELTMKKGCTDVLQTFHKPQKTYQGMCKALGAVGNLMSQIESNSYQLCQLNTKPRC